MPDPAAEGLKLAVRNHEALFDRAGVLWLVRQIGNGERIQLDKSCDKGATLSGSIDLPLGPSIVQLLGP
ncbi:MAG: hypothetical protein U0270_00230 [Labilithrix sp.]